MKKLFIILIILLALAGSAVAFITYVCEDGWCYIFPWQGVPFEITGEPTDFEKEGVIEFGDPLSDRLIYMYLFYQESGKSVSKELVLDSLSACADQSGSTPCIAMSVTPDVPYGGNPRPQGAEQSSYDGRRAVVEGKLQSDGSLLVRKLRRLEEGEPAMLSQAGHVFIPWPQAQMLIESCAVRMVVQTHSLNVNLTLSDGRKVVSVEPVIDEIFSVTQNASPFCGSIPIATE